MGQLLIKLLELLLVLQVTVSQPAAYNLLGALRCQKSTVKKRKGKNVGPP